jgi:hypothetical protein
MLCSLDLVRLNASFLSSPIVFLIFNSKANLELELLFPLIRNKCLKNHMAALNDIIKYVCMEDIFN